MTTNLAALRCWLGRHDWYTTQSGLYGEMQRCRRCTADRVAWSHYFKERHG